MKDAFKEGNGGGREASGGLEICTWSAPACVRACVLKKKRGVQEEKEKERVRERRRRIVEAVSLAGTHRSIDAMSPSRCVVRS